MGEGRGRHMEEVRQFEGRLRSEHEADFGNSSWKDESDDFYGCTFITICHLVARTRLLWVRSATKERKQGPGGCAPLHGVLFGRAVSQFWPVPRPRRALPSLVPPPYSHPPLSPYHTLSHLPFML